MKHHGDCPLNKRPHSITVLSCLFILVGSVALVYHLLPQHIGEFRSPGELMWVCGVRVLAIIAGAFMWFGFNWARWLLVIWIAFHVVISAFHSLFEVTVHASLFVLITWFLFRPAAGVYFNTRPGAPPEMQNQNEA